MLKWVHPYIHNSWTILQSLKHWTCSQWQPWTAIGGEPMMPGIRWRRVRPDTQGSIDGPSRWSWFQATATLKCASRGEPIARCRLLSAAAMLGFRDSCWMSIWLMARCFVWFVAPALNSLKHHWSPPCTSTGMLMIVNATKPTLSDDYSQLRSNSERRDGCQTEWNSDDVPEGHWKRSVEFRDEMWMGQNQWDHAMPGHGISIGRNG